MIVYYLGLPGSGKSYSGVNTIYNNFSKNEDAKKDLKKDYQVCYTNINEFKFDKVKNVYLFDEEDIFKKLNTLYEMYRKKANDEELIEQCKEFKLYRALFVLDECHKYFDVEKKFLVWWLTYHRHLYHDLILITQSLSLVHSKYKPLAEAFYKAKSSSLTLNQKYFNYMYYTEARLTKASFVNTVKVKKRQSVFELYKSGDSIDSKNVIKRFLFISLFFVLFLFLFAYFFYYEKSTDIKSNKVSIPVIKENKNISNSSLTYSRDDKDDINDLNFEDKKLIILNCTYSSCSNDLLFFPPKLIKKFIDMELLHVYYKDEISKTLIIYYLSSSLDFYNFLTSYKGGKDEKDSSASIDLFNHSSE